ncbi:putative glutamyl-tRNA subunit a protein [Neofusicoccum parvum]|nr:putative glutamyl-tRNA subunit a protein [Neofusicoccum parvum]
MLEKIRWPASLAASHLFSAFAILGFSAAALVDNGKVVTLNSVSYYHGGIPVAQLSGLSFPALQDEFPGQDTLPLTVIHTGASVSLSVHEYNATLSDFRNQDDVFQDGFLQAVYVLPSGPSNVSTAELDACASFSRKVYMTKVFMTSGLSTPIPNGPYFISMATGNIFKAYRLYTDEYLAFTQPAVGDERDGFLPLSATSEDLMTRSVAVPSRLYYSRSASQPLAGLRLAVKDIFHVKGLRTSGGSRAYYYTYGRQNTTASSVQRLLDLGAVFVGKTGTAQFANGDRPTADWVDVHCPFNPRGDGYQVPSGSSSGSAVAIAAYDWLDMAVGSDTGGSMRSPARLNGVFGNRPSTGAVSMDGVLPLSPHLDTAGVFTRSPALWSHVTRHWYHGGSAAATNFSAYPRSIYVSTNSTSTAAPEALALLDAFVWQLERLFGTTHTATNISQHWAATSQNTTSPLPTLLNQTYAILTATDQRALLATPFLAAHAALHANTTPYINPDARTRWAWAAAAVPPATHAAALRDAAAFRRWWRGALGRPDAAACSEGVYVHMTAAGAPAYRDAYVAPRVAPPVGFADWAVAGFAGAPEVVLPVGEVGYLSEVTGRREWLPVAVNLMVARGCDGMLAALVEELEREGVVRDVGVGRRLWGE